MLAGVVLCGGASRRMGRDKALIEVDGEPLIARVSRRVAEIADPVYIAAGDRRYPVDNEHIDDAAPDSGPLGGLVAGLRASPHELVAVVAADMPFASPDVLRLLAGLVDGYDAVIPRDDHGLQPLHAVYSTKSLPKLEAAMDRGILSLTGVVESLKVRVVVPREWSVVDTTGAFSRNVNEEHDLEVITTPSPFRK